jgi:hypothetical protein
VVIDHKERELHRMCYRSINDENENAPSTIFNDAYNEGISDFDLNAYLAEHIPSADEKRQAQSTDRVQIDVDKLSDTDRRILQLMDYYEKQ